jgi:hypothetical protein
MAWWVSVHHPWLKMNFKISVKTRNAIPFNRHHLKYLKPEEASMKEIQTHRHEQKNGVTFQHTLISETFKICVILIRRIQSVNLCMHTFTCPGLCD